MIPTYHGPQELGKKVVIVESHGNEGLSKEMLAVG